MAKDRKRLSLLGAHEVHPADLGDLASLGEVDVDGDPSSAEEADLAIWVVDGDDQAEGLDNLAARVPTIVLAKEERLIEMVDRGCRGFLGPSSTAGDVTEAARVVLNGGAVVPPEMLGSLLRHVVQRRRKEEAVSSLLNTLTERERQVYELAVRGARKEDIGERLFISPATVRTHLQRVYRKLGVHSQTELMSLRGYDGPISGEGVSRG